MDQPSHPASGAVLAATITPPGNQRAPIRWLHVLLITLLGALLRFWRIGQQSGWLDEAFTAYRLAGSFTDCMQSLNNQGFGPVWYALMYGYKSLITLFLGDGAEVFHPAVLRIVPAVCGTLVVPGMYLLAREFRTTASHRKALFIAFLAAINPYSIYYSRDTKMYGLLITLFAFQMAFVLRFIHRRQKSDWITATLCLVTLALTHLTAGWLIVIHALTLACCPSARHRRVAGAIALMWFAALIGPGLWYTQWTNVMGRFSKDQNSVGISWIGYTYQLNAHLVLESPCMLLAGLAIPRDPSDFSMQRYFLLGEDVTLHRTLALTIGAVLGMLLVLLVIGQFSGWRQRVDPERSARPGSTLAPQRLLYLWATVPVVILILASLPAQNRFSIWPHYMIYQPRFLIVCWPALVLLLGVALNNLPGVGWMPLRQILAWIMIVTMLSSALTNHLTQRVPPHMEMCAMAKPYLDRSRPQELALLESRADYLDLDPVYACQVSFGYRPVFDMKAVQTWRFSKPQMPVRFPIRLGDDPGEWRQSIWLAQQNRALRVIVTCDRLGDSAKLSDTEVLDMLGAGWEKRGESWCWMHNEWHPYVSFHFRTRVWVRTVSPTTQPSTRHSE